MSTIGVIRAEIGSNCPGEKSRERAALPEGESPIQLIGAFKSDWLWEGVQSSLRDAKSGLRGPGVSTPGYVRVAATRLSMTAFKSVLRAEVMTWGKHVD